MAEDGNIKLFSADLDNPVSAQRCPADGSRMNSRPCASGLRCRISTGVDVATVALLFSLLINTKKYANSEGQSFYCGISLFPGWLKPPANICELTFVRHLRFCNWKIIGRVNTSVWASSSDDCRHRPAPIADKLLPEECSPMTVWRCAENPHHAGSAVPRRSRADHAASPRRNRFQHIAATICSHQTLSSALIAPNAAKQLFLCKISTSSNPTVRSKSS